MDAPTTDDPRLLRLDPADNVCAATTPLKAGEQLRTRDGSITLSDDVAVGHKVAVEAIPRGEKVRKYGAIIGSASADIAAGDHVHTHNLSSDYIPTYARGEADQTPAATRGGP